MSRPQPDRPGHDQHQDALKGVGQADGPLTADIEIDRDDAKNHDHAGPDRDPPAAHHRQNVGGPHRLEYRIGQRADRHHQRRQPAEQRTLVAVGNSRALGDMSEALAEGPHLGAAIPCHQRQIGEIDHHVEDGNALAVGPAGRAHEGVGADAARRDQQIERYRPHASPGNAPLLQAIHQVPATCAQPDEQRNADVPQGDPQRQQTSRHEKTPAASDWQGA